MPEGRLQWDVQRESAAAWAERAQADRHNLIRVMPAKGAL
jgi:hypothetical protein